MKTRVGRYCSKLASGETLGSLSRVRCDMLGCTTITNFMSRVSHHDSSEQLGPLNYNPSMSHLIRVSSNDYSVSSKLKCENRLDIDICRNAISVSAANSPRIYSPLYSLTA